MALVDIGNWSHIPFYVVGEATAKTLEKMTVSHPSKFSKSLIIGARETGKSESLARFIINDLPTRSSGRKLLYFTGDKNRDTFHRILTDSKVDVHGLMVYETVEASDLGDKIAEVVNQIVLSTYSARTFR